MRRRLVGIANQPTKVMLMPNTIWDTCITTVTECSRIEFRRTTCFSELLTGATKMRSGRLNVPEKGFQSTPARALGACNKGHIVIVDENRP